MRASRFVAKLTSATVPAGRSSPPAHRRGRRPAAGSGWGPPAQLPLPWRPGVVERARAAGLMLCGAVVGGVLLAAVLGVVVWLMATGIHHVASG